MTAKPSSPSKLSESDGACGLIVKDQRVLLGLRSPEKAAYPRTWDLFGGHAEPPETAEETIVRELREELDITPTEFQYLSTQLDPYPEKHGHCSYHLFKVTAWSGPGPRLCGDEHSEIRWCTLDEALALDLALPAYRNLFAEHLA